VVTISYTGRDPEFAATIANAFAQAYIATTLELKVEPAREYAAWFDERTRGLRNDLEQAQRRLSEYEQEHGIVATAGRLDLETARLVELSTQLVTVQGQRADSRSRQSQAAAGEALPEVMQNPLISNLKGELAKKEAERRQLSGRVGPNHPELARINAEIASMRERLSEEIQRIARSLDTTTLISTANEAEIAAVVKEQHARVLELKSHRDQIAVLQRDVESAQRTHDLVAQRLAHSNLESQSQQTNVSVLTPASPPLYASGPRKLLVLALAGIVGGLLGTGAALLLEFRDPRLRRPAELAALSGAPLLGVIPDNGRPGGQDFRTSRPLAA
jgi:chain length determinant protein EpsF